MLTRPFLTELDSRAAVKGSVDPLGIQSIWTHFGRFLVGNLTTVSTSATDFTILLVGYYLAERVSELDGPSEVATFLKWEQLAAYSRTLVNGETGFRGTTRTRKYLAEGTRVTLSVDQTSQILGNQKTYGIFGLYSNPARASGLLEPDQPRLTLPARELVERYLLPMLSAGAGREARRLVRRLVEDSVRMDLGRRDKQLTHSVAEVLHAHANEGVRDFYRRHLLFGGPNDSTGGRQRELAAAYAETFDEEEYELAPSQLRGLVRRAKAAGHTDTAVRLEAIRTAESAMAPLAAAFGFALQRDGATLADVADELTRAWGEKVSTVEAADLEQLEGELRTATGNDTAASRFVHAAEVLRAGDYEGMLRLLLQQNAWVMDGRGGAPWAEERRGKLHVRLRFNEGRLPARKALPQLWRHAYFLDSVRSIGSSVGIA